MKKIKTYIGIMAALLTMLTACSDSMVDNGVPSKNETGTYQAHFTISVPNYSKVESRVANFATEGIASANDMKLLCFDKDGYFLGLARNLNIESVGSNDIKADGGSDKKNISATIPTGTARIHIMANATEGNTVTTGNQPIDFSKSAERQDGVLGLCEEEYSRRNDRIPHQGCSGKQCDPSAPQPCQD